MSQQTLNSSMVYFRNWNNIPVQKNIWNSDIKKQWVYWEYPKNIFLDTTQRHPKKKIGEKKKKEAKFEWKITSKNEQKQYKGSWNNESWVS